MSEKTATVQQDKNLPVYANVVHLRQIDIHSVCISFSLQLGSLPLSITQDSTEGLSTKDAGTDTVIPLNNIVLSNESARQFSEIVLSWLNSNGR